MNDSARELSRSDDSMAQHLDDKMADSKDPLPGGMR